jgi:hypothetical protein
MALGRIESVDGDSNWPILRYVNQVIEHAAKDVWRERHGVEYSDRLETQPGREPSPERWAVGRQLWACIERAVTALKEDDQFIFVLKARGVSAVAIAADLHRIFKTVISTQAIDTRFSRLRVKIGRECL